MEHSHTTTTSTQHSLMLPKYVHTCISVENIIYCGKVAETSAIALYELLVHSNISDAKQQVRNEIAAELIYIQKPATCAASNIGSHS